MIFNTTSAAPRRKLAVRICRPGFRQQAMSRVLASKARTGTQAGPMVDDVLRATIEESIATKRRLLERCLPQIRALNDLAIATLRTPPAN